MSPCAIGLVAMAECYSVGSALADAFPTTPRFVATRPPRRTLQNSGVIPVVSVDLPRITVVTPSFNQGRFLEQTIRSVLDQGYPNLEYMICDGGSTDESVDVIKKYETRLAFWSTGKDKGQTDAINKGMRRATGDLLTYINSDDILYPGSMMAAARAFRDGHEWITGWAMFLEPDGGEWPQLPELFGSRALWFLA